MFDGRGLIEYASPSVSRALGLRQDELIGRLWRAITHPEDVPDAARARWPTPGPTSRARRCSSCACARATASWRWVEGQATLRFHNGSAVAVEITGRDVTRTRAAEDRAAGCPRSSRRSWPARPTAS